MAYNTKRTVDTVWTLPAEEARRRTWSMLADALDRLLKAHDDPRAAIAIGILEELGTAAAWAAEVGLAHPEAAEQDELDEVGALVEEIAADLYVDGGLIEEKLEKVRQAAAKAHEHADEGGAVHA